MTPSTALSFAKYLDLYHSPTGATDGQPPSGTVEAANFLSRPMARGGWRAAEVVWGIAAWCGEPSRLGLDCTHVANH